MVDRGKRMEKGSIKIRIPEEQKVFFLQNKKHKISEALSFNEIYKKGETKFKLMFQVIWACQESFQVHMTMSQ